MSADRMDTKAWRDLNAQLNRIALAAERIADALEKYVENDPLAAVTKALEAETGPDTKCPNCGWSVGAGSTRCLNCAVTISTATVDLNPGNKPCPECGGELVSDEFPDSYVRFLRCVQCDWRSYQARQASYGSDLPESERWRLGS